MATELKTACREPTGLHRALVLIAIGAAALMLQRCAQTFELQVTFSRPGPIGLEALVHDAFLAAQPWNVRAARYSLMQGDDDDGNRWSR